MIFIFNDLTILDHSQLPGDPSDLFQSTWYSYRYTIPGANGDGQLTYKVGVNKQSQCVETFQFNAPASSGLTWTAALQLEFKQYLANRK